MSRYAALLDACVLVPVTLADSLLRVADQGLYRPLWSSRILEEVVAAICEVHPEIPEDRIRRRVSDMGRYFPEAQVQGWGQLLDWLHLPDPDDRHVLAAAIRGRADAIVTANIKDFPADVVGSFDIEVVHPDAFLLDQLDLDRNAVLEALRDQARHARHPALSARDLARRLTRAGVPEFAEEIKHLL
ncbi:MAG: PIN domain-containing protein [Actinomycetota bacterium]|nr:PIN domain-containing protein [Actinomycetota bacterium]